MNIYSNRLNMVESVVRPAQRHKNQFQMEKNFWTLLLVTCAAVKKTRLTSCQHQGADGHRFLRLTKPSSSCEAAAAYSRPLQNVM